GRQPPEPIKHQGADAPRSPGLWWGVALVGQFVFVFSAVALSGPGRIDIVDGQTRFEVARSLVEHGDSAIRDERVWFWTFPGRDGQRHTPYRFPQSVLGAGAIWLADATGPVSEGRRHFFFVLTSAFACALLPLAYALWFRHIGLGPGAALFWSTAGVFCTPSWFYGTSTFDDILGSAALVLAMSVALMTRHRHALLGAAAAGLLLGLAFNCKEPLGIFGFAVLAANRDPDRPWRAQLGRVALVLAGLALGVIAYRAYDLAKFAPKEPEVWAHLFRGYPPFWPDHPTSILAAFLGLTISPGAGVLWYSPTLALCLYGLARWRTAQPQLCRAVIIGCLIVLGFLCCLTFFAGDPAWGPRYLTPVLALLWLFAPLGAKWLRPGTTRLLLRLGLIVQMLALAVDPHRLYLERGLPSAFYLDIGPWVYFDSAASHLLNRPREIVAVVSPSRPPAYAFTPSHSPTFAFPVLNHIGRPDARLATVITGQLAQGGVAPLTTVTATAATMPMDFGPAAVQRYHILNTPRPWWASQWYLPQEQRPVDLAGTLALLVGTLGAGLVLMRAGWRGSMRRSGFPA
ncbi:MAG: hypothetical protein L0Z62_10660, partial [Gemmataceae bacterium]|nr:hypothetical protein [Gemmataceae bacterium]